MGILVVYDTVGIQDYIFASNKLVENVGGSKLVADVFAKQLPEAIDKVTGQTPLDWRQGGTLNSTLKAEIIYQGGGNAYIAFADEETFQNVTKVFLISVNQTAPGIGIAVAAIETDFGITYKSDFEKLNKRLALAKGNFNIPVFAGNQSITKQSGRTGLPVSTFRNNEYLSQSQVKKRDRHSAYKKEESNSKINDFDDLVFDKGKDSLIAIIHADGNNMGKRIKVFMEQFKTYTEAVPEIRKLSTKIETCYKAARERAITLFNNEYSEYIIELSEKYPNKEYKTVPPILELIGDGDDTTLVTSGRFALDFAARLLREIEKTPHSDRPFEEIEPTACAGVVIFHSHYPFSEAYKLAEELCSSAKKPSRSKEGSYIDFHLHQSGTVADLGQLRERQYKVEGKTILRRPWRVSEDNEDTFPSFKWFEENIQSISEMPRNKTKAIRNAIGIGDSAAKLAENQLRDARLPKLPSDMSVNMSKYAALFDMLEVYDVYKNLLNKGGGSDDRQQNN